MNRDETTSVAHDERRIVACVMEALWKHCEKQRDDLRGALEQLLETMELPPDRNCSCHLSPPCNDCVEYSGIRNAIEWAEKVLAEGKGQS